MYSENQNGSVLFADKYLIPYLNIAKNCGNETEGDCSFKIINNNTSITYLNDTYSRFYLSDGTFIATRAWVSNSQTNPYKYITLRIDINGQKMPNRYGKDIFMYQYIIRVGNDEDESMQGKFVPEGKKNGTQFINDNCSSGGSGQTCAAKIMMDGWQIKDDYPW